MNSEFWTTPQDARVDQPAIYSVLLNRSEGLSNMGIMARTQSDSDDIVASENLNTSKGYR
jgi:hypothetical protein